jgi:hypothetical protein
MGLMQKMFGGAAKPAPPAGAKARNSGPAPDGTSVLPAGRMRREMLRLVLRQSLTRNGIPSTWIVAETLEVPARGESSGVHIRLVLQHWEPRLLPYTLAFEHDLEQRLLAVEPDAHSWFRGFSWQYAALGDPGSMPDPSTWAPAEPAPVPEQAPALPREAPAFVAEAPASSPAMKSKEELAALFAQQDRTRSKADEQVDFAPTQPVSW